MDAEFFPVFAIKFVRGRYRIFEVGGGRPKLGEKGLQTGEGAATLGMAGGSRLGGGGVQPFYHPL